MKLLYLGVLVLTTAITIAGIVGHSIVESEKWHKIFKQRGRDDE